MVHTLLLCSLQPITSIPRLWYTVWRWLSGTCDVNGQLHLLSSCLAPQISWQGLVPFLDFKAGIIYTTVVSAVHLRFLVVIKCFDLLEARPHCK
jgi:hypothetical protein